MPATAEVVEEALPPAVFGIDYAGFWIRLLATLVDAIPLTVISVLVQLVTEDIATGVVLRVLLSATYTIGFWVAADGATPGKMAMGIKIMRTNGEPMGVATALLRYVGYAVSAAVFLLGFALIGVAPQKRGLHDYMAQTVVVRVR
jgi:uncharacterized RDD family membrane protein YckC